MTRRPLVTGLVLVAILVLAGCGAAPRRGVELGNLRTLARRVEGGGVECPISIAPSLLRPSTVPSDSTILPFRIDGSGAVGVVGQEAPDVTLPDADSVQITCRYKIDALRVDVVILGVPRGNAISGLLPTFRRVSGLSVSQLTPFLYTNAQLPVGRSGTVPGKGRAAYSRVSAARGDVGLVFAVATTDERVALPDDDEVAATARKVARALAN